MKAKGVQMLCELLDANGLSIDGLVHLMVADYDSESAYVGTMCGAQMKVPATFYKNALGRCEEITCEGCRAKAGG